MEGESLEGYERVEGGGASYVDKGEAGYDNADKTESIDRKLERRMDLSRKASASYFDH